jgi:hypothetical protein
VRGVRLQLAWTALALLAGCVDKTGFALVKNTCITNAECTDLGAVCDLGLQQCVRETVEEPYQVILQVRPGTGGVELPEGASLVDQETWPPFEFNASIEHHPLQVPLSQLVTGRVSRKVEPDGEEQPVEAELTFSPEDQTVPVSTPTVIYTRGTSGGLLDNLNVNLNPNVRYSVRVQPLLDDSKTLAPFTTSYSTAADGTDVAITFPEMAQRGGVLLDERRMPLVDYRIRLEDKQTGEILSSTATTGAGGSFELFAPATVMASQSFYVVVSLKPFPLWRMKVAVDGSKLAPNVVLIIPSAPSPVAYQGSVEAETRTGKGAPAAYADVIFTSRFPVPQSEEEKEPRGKDWCSWRSATPGPPPVCSAQITTSTDPEGRFSVQLLPGDYDVFISPSSASGSGTPLSTKKEAANVLSQPGGAQVSASWRLARAIQFDGRVQSASREPMPNVIVRARPLASSKYEDEVYKYARSAAAVTQGRGTFELDVDLGYFDLTVEPPSESGFAWVHSLNRVVRGEPERPVGPLQPSPPVPVSGTVQYLATNDAGAPEDTPLAGAQVEAFALINKGPGGRRAVRIAQTVTDDTGAYRLALPPAVREEEPDDAGVDAAHSE